MRPKDLKSDYTWETRRPYLKDGVLYVPDYYFEHEKFQMPSCEEVFGNQFPVEIEFCSGNGDWIVEKAKQNPECNYIAVEMLFERVRKIYSKRENLGIKNLLIVCGEGLTFSKFYLPSNLATAAYVNFPDPWPKARHAKHRIVQEEFLHEMERILKPEGTFCVATDDDDYCAQIGDLLTQANWISKYGSFLYKTDITNYGYSFFDHLWRKKGKTIKYMKFISQKGESL